VITIVGVVADALGAASQLVTVESGAAGRNFDVKRQFGSVPSTAREHQKANWFVAFQGERGTTKAQVLTLASLVYHRL
jgi:hypothetical protein